MPAKQAGLNQHEPAAAESGLHARYQLTLANKDRAGFTLDVEFTAPGTGVTAIFGPSGCGKTTLLRCLAGLQATPDGYLCVNGETWHDQHSSLPTHQRAIGYVFQEANLFPHLTARGNLEFARRRAFEPLSTARVDALIELMGIGNLLEQKPQQLSGGERQRVAIARALLVNPRLLLMDEPLAALDHKRKQDILPFLEALHREFSLPILYVTHSLDEVARLADHLLLMEAGQIVARGPLNSVLSRLDLPMDLGEDAGAVLSGELLERDQQWQLARIGLAGGGLWVKDSGEALGTTLRLRVLARDVSLARSAADQSSILNRLPVRVQSIEDDADSAMALIRLQLQHAQSSIGGPVSDTGGDSDVLLARVSRRSVHDLQLQQGDAVWAQIKSVAILR